MSDGRPHEIVAEQLPAPAPPEFPVVVAEVQQQLKLQHQIEPEP